MRDDIWARVDEAVSEVQVRGIVSELLARAEAAEAVVDGVRRRHHRRTESRESGCISCGRLWPCPDYLEADALLGSESAPTASDAMSEWGILSTEGFVDPMAEALEQITREMAADVWGRLFWGPGWRLGAAMTRRRPAPVRLDDLAARLRIPAALVAEWQEAKRCEDDSIPLMPSPPLVIPFWRPREPALPPSGTPMKWSREDIRRQAAIDARQVEHQRGDG